MEGNLFRGLLGTAGEKVMLAVSKGKMWTSWDFIRARGIAGIRNGFASLLDVRPRHKDDYYPVFGWMVSRRLAAAVLAAAGVLSICYLAGVYGILEMAGEEGIKTYAYDSVMLRFARGKVRIKGEGGYVAYEGDVKDGEVTGYGILYNRAGAAVYQGDFDKNMYQGGGTRYYDSGAVMYTGNFQGNLFDGAGRYYRENGSLAYDGEFLRGKREGEGKLYDNGGNLVYTGGFSQDEVLYSGLLGKSVSEVAEAYKGKRVLYENPWNFAVVLEDIDAMYAGEDGSRTLDGEITVERVLVLKDFFGANGKMMTTVEELRQFFGAEEYEGNSEADMAEAVAMDWMARERGGFRNGPQVETAAEYEDYFVVEDFEADYVVYLYSFSRDGLVYTFVCQDREKGFSFYSIEKGEGGDAA